MNRSCTALMDWLARSCFWAQQFRKNRSGPGAVRRSFSPHFLFLGVLLIAMVATPPKAFADFTSATKSFSPATVVAGNSSTLTITLTNSPPGNPSSIAFTDLYPANLFNAAIPAVTTSCDGIATAEPNGTSLRLTGGSLRGNNSCTVTVAVHACIAGSYINPSFTVTSTTPDINTNAATLTVAAGSISNATLSTVSASADLIPADGVSTSTITVTLRDGCGNPVSGKTVSLTAGSGSSIISAPSGTSNASGIVTFTVRSFTAEGPITYTATSTTDAVTIAQTAEVTFTRILAPSVTKSFNPMSISAGGASIMTITLSNPNTGQIRSAAFTDLYPAGLVNASTPGLSNSCGGTASGAAGGSLLSLAGGTIPASGSCSVSITVTSGTAGAYNNSSGIVTSSNAEDGTASETVLNVLAAVSDFNAVDTGTHPEAGKLFTKIAGNALSFDIVALDASNALAAGFRGTVSVEIVDATSGGACGTLPVIATFPNQTFTAADAGRHPLSAGNAISNSWANARVRITFAGPPSVVRCSGDSFAIRPASLTINAVSDATTTTAGTTRVLNNLAFVAGGNVHHAGRPFTIRATAANSSGATTTNYAGTPTAFLSACQTPGAACTGTFGALPTGVWSAAGGVVTTSVATYSDVGSFGLQLEDRTFANVDASDGTPDSQRFIPLSAKVDTGRFVPDSYVLTLPSMTNRTDIPGCHVQTTGSVGALSTSLTVVSPANLAVGDSILVRGAGASGANLTATINAISGNVLTLGTAATTAVTNAVVYKVAFTYHGETMGLDYRITARNANSAAALPNYNGIWARGLVLIQAENNNDGIDRGPRIAGATSNWVNGVYNVNSTNATFARNIAPDGPFHNLQIGVSVLDPDGPVLQGRTMNPLTTANCLSDMTCTGAAIGTIGMRFGRLKLSNAHGSELLNLPVPIGTEFWSGSYFVPNTSDRCTSISAANVKFGGHQGGINFGNMASPANVTIGGAFEAGTGSLVLTKPIPRPSAKGSVDITVDLAAENKTYLRTGLNFSSDPTARATFGIYKRDPISKQEPIIYLREMY